MVDQKWHRAIITGQSRSRKGTVGNRHGKFKVSFQVEKKKKTRPSVNYAKDWLDHSFLFPGLVWSEKEFNFGYDH